MVGDLRNFGWKLGDEEYEGTRTNSPAPPESVVLHEAAVGLHGEEASLIEVALNGLGWIGVYGSIDFEHVC